ncbi:MAG: Rieske 2Fe-2S domain-containing protein [Chloroflexota bacterium]
MIKRSIMADQDWWLGRVADVPPGEGRTFRAGDEEVAVFHTRSGQVFATQARCPHLGGPLADGMLGGSTLVCPLHGFKFDLASGRPAGNECPALRTFPVSVGEGGELFVRIEADGTKAP